MEPNVCGLLGRIDTTRIAGCGDYSSGGIGIGVSTETVLVAVRKQFYFGRWGWHLSARDLTAATGIDNRIREGQTAEINSIVVCVASLIGGLIIGITAGRLGGECGEYVPTAFHKSNINEYQQYKARNTLHSLFSFPH